MNKSDIITALKDLGIPHDPEAKAPDLDKLRVAVINAAEKAASDSVAREIELQNEVKALGAKASADAANFTEVESSLTEAEEEIESLKASLAALTESGADEAEPDEFEEAIAEAVKAKMAAGLPREKAFQVVHAQIDHDTAQHNAENPEPSETESE